MGTHPIFESDFDCLTDYRLRFNTTEKFNSYNKSKVKSMVVRPTCSLGQAEIETAVATPFTYLSDYTKKKIRNLEKRKTKLESYKNKLKSGEKLTPDQYEAVKKFDEVLGMITFANELISHMNQMGEAVEKGKTKRATLAQTEAEGDKLQCLTRQIELYTLMHLTKDELVGTLREECSFLPSPGASLHHFAAGTAKHLINLTEPDGKLEPINYQNVKEKLEEIEPSFNPVPEYEYEDEEEDEEDDAVVDAVIDDDDQEIDVELVKLAAKKDEPPAEEDEVVNEVTGSGDATPMEEVANESYEIDVVNDHHDYCEDQQEPVLYDEPAQVEAAPKEEEQIKEILTEVTSQFNFMAPAESDEEELVDESPIHFETVIPTIPTTAQLPATNGFVEGLQQENIVPLQHQQTAPPQQPQQQLTPEFGYNNGFVANIETPVEEAIKDELNWQQKLPSQQQQQQKKAQSSSYKNSQRYQRQFNGNNSRQTNGDTASRGSRYNGNSRGHRRGGGGGGGGGAKPE